MGRNRTPIPEQYWLKVTFIQVIYFSKLFKTMRHGRFHFFYHNEGKIFFSLVETHHLTQTTTKVCKNHK